MIYHDLTMFEEMKQVKFVRWNNWLQIDNFYVVSVPRFTVSFR